VKLLIVGDTHGNGRWLREYIYPVAMTLGVEAIIQLGDFGAWEHLPEGVTFMDEVGDLSRDSGIPLYWLHGNHDKHSHTIEAYQRDQRGFLVCREFVFYIPQGHAWTWGGVSIRAFGGAYSVDKAGRVEAEMRKKVGQGTFWFPEEEMSDAEMDQLLAADDRPKDIVLSHDKPYSSRPGWNRKNIPACIPNQLRLDRALKAHQPAYWFHGHLHYHYTDKVFSGNYRQSMIFGLDPDDNAADRQWKRTQTWAYAELDDGTVDVAMGYEKYLPPEVMQEHIASLG
jgi:hypothetical protein